MFGNPMEWFELSTPNSNGWSASQRNDDNKRLNKVLQQILCEVFIHEYRQHYLGEDTPELRYFILSSEKVYYKYQSVIYVFSN